MKKKCDCTKHATQSPDGKMYVMRGFEFLDPEIDPSLGLGRNEPFWYVTTSSEGHWLFLNAHPVLAREKDRQVVHIDHEIIELVEAIWAHGLSLVDSCQDYTAYCNLEESQLNPTPNDKRYFWLMFNTIKDMNQLRSMLMPMQGEERDRFFGEAKPRWLMHIEDENDARLVIPWRDYQYALERLKGYGHLLPSM
jgi:hypothetical protein